MVAPGHFVVETNGKECDFWQEEEHDDESMKVGLSFIDHEGVRRCAISGMLVGNACSLYRGCSTFCPERVDHEGAFMVKFSRASARPLSNTSCSRSRKVSLSFARSVVGRTDGQVHVVVGGSDWRTDARSDGGRSDMEMGV